MPQHWETAWQGSPLQGAIGEEGSEPRAESHSPGREDEDELQPGFLTIACSLLVPL